MLQLFRFQTPWMCLWNKWKSICRKYVELCIVGIWRNVTPTTWAVTPAYLLISHNLCHGRSILHYKAITTNTFAQWRLKKSHKSHNDSCATNGKGFAMAYLMDYRGTFSEALVIGTTLEQSNSPRHSSSRHLNVPSEYPLWKNAECTFNTSIMCF